MDSNTLLLLNIIIVLIIGVGSWYFAVRHTKKSINEKKIKYRINSLAMVSKSFLIDDLSIRYKNTLLTEPIVVTLHIINAGNVALENPPIKLKTSSGQEIIPLGFSSVPSGYDDLWRLKKENENKNSCFIELEHINPNQVVRAVFILTEKPKNKDELIFECPMKDLVLEQTLDKDAFNNEISITGGAGLIFTGIKKIIRKIW